MLNFENCRTWGRTYDEKPTDIIIGGSIVNIDYTADATYWIDRLGMKLTYTATDRDGRNYEVFTNPDRNLATAVPVKEKKGA